MMTATVADGDAAVVAFSWINQQVSDECGLSFLHFPACSRH